MIVYVLRLTASVTEVEAVPLYSVNLQIADGTRTSGVAKAMAERLEAYSDSEISIRVVEISSFKRQPVAESFVVSRVEDKSAAEKLATMIGVDRSTVEYRPLENNSEQISVTLVIGDDYQRINSILELTEEK